VVVAGEPFHYNADGEVRGPVDRRLWTIRPEGWHLLAPRRGAEPTRAGP
jgi:hypothetical protein